MGSLKDRIVKVVKAFDSACDYLITRDYQKAAGGGRTATPRSVGGKFSGGGMGMRQWSGDPYQQLIEYRNWVYTAVRFRAIQRQTPPCVVKVVEKGTTEKHLREMRKSLSIEPRKFVHMTKGYLPAGARQDTELEYLPADSDAMKLFHNPNDPQIGTDLWFLASVFEDLTGRAFIWKVRNGAGQVVELWILPTPWVDPQPGNDRLIDFYKVTMPAGGTETIDADDIITIGEPSPYGYLTWNSPLQAHGLNVDLFNAIVTARFNGLVNGANVGSLIKVPSSMYGDPEKMERFERSLLARVVGGINYNRPLIAEDGADLINLTPQMEVAFAESSKTARADIFAAFDLDEQAMGYSNFTTKASAVTVDSQIHKKVVKPYHDRRNAILTEKLLVPDFGAELVAINEWHAEEVPDEKDKRIRLMMDAGAITINEIRKEFGKEPFEGAEYDEPIPGSANIAAMGKDEMDDDSDSSSGSDATADRRKMLNLLQTTHKNGDGVHHDR